MHGSPPLETGHGENPMNQSDTDRLRQDLRRVVDDVEQVLQSMAGATGEHANDLKSKASQRLHEARERLNQIENDAVVRVRAAGERTEDLVQHHPWIAIGGASAAAFLLGMWSMTRH
jgi:ElaB/YqjD/DUF883 family membrane-anchored ribosome-binding protein